MNLCMVAHLWSTNIFGYDKLWGPSQRVVTLFSLNIGEIVLNAWAGCANVNVWYSLLFHNCPKDYKVLKRFLELS